jgi:hypothetical protein
MARNSIRFAPNDRYAMIGKTGSGKTHTSMALFTLITAVVNEKAIQPWSVWWVDSKGDPGDIARLRQWGYERVKHLNGLDPDGPELYRYFKLETRPGEENVAPQVAEIARCAYQRSKHPTNPRPTLLVIDEWTQVIFSRQNMGPRLLDIEQRGRGNRCGLAGLTQEPVYVPRQLLSQATHQFLFSLSHVADIDHVRNFCPAYEPPNEKGHTYGFWYRHVDGNAKWQFFAHEAEFFDWVKSSLTSVSVYLKNRADQVAESVG